MWKVKWMIFGRVMAESRTIFFLSQLLHKKRHSKIINQNYLIYSRTLLTLLEKNLLMKNTCIQWQRIINHKKNFVLFDKSLLFSLLFYLFIIFPSFSIFMFLFSWCVQLQWKSLWCGFKFFLGSSCKSWLQRCLLGISTFWEGKT